MGMPTTFECSVECTCNAAVNVLESWRNVSVRRACCHISIRGMHATNLLELDDDEDEDSVGMVRRDIQNRAIHCHAHNRNFSARHCEHECADMLKFKQSSPT